MNPPSVYRAWPIPDGSARVARNGVTLPYVFATVEHAEDWAEGMNEEEGVARMPELPSDEATGAF